jgi:hypothetical protein
MLKFIFIILSVFVTTPLWAQERVYLKACSIEYSAEALVKFARSLASPLDQIDQDNTQPCIDIFTSIAKQDLFVRGLKLKFRNIEIDTVDSAPSIVSGEHQCHLQFISEAQQKQNERQGQIIISNKNIQGKIYDQQYSGEQSQTASLMASHLRSSITIDWHTFSATCRKNNNGASVDIEISGPTLNLKNSIYLSPNTKQYLGEVSRNTSGSGHQVGTIGIGGNSGIGNETKKIFIQLR